MNIGRNAEIHGQETDVYICDAQMDNVGIFTTAFTPDQSCSSEQAALWLDFETETTLGSFFSYGIGARTYGSIWPDRTVQPEMWQMKKSVQPISISWLDAGNGWIEVWNRSHFLNSSYYRTKWFLEADGTVLDEGELDLRVAPLSKAKVQIPFKKPVIQAGAEYRITFSSTLRNKECWAPAGFEVAWDQLELPWHREKEVETVSISPVSLEQEKGQILISGTDFKYVLIKSKGH